MASPEVQISEGSFQDAIRNRFIDCTLPVKSGSGLATMSLGEKTKNIGFQTEMAASLVAAGFVINRDIPFMFLSNLHLDTQTLWMELQKHEEELRGAHVLFSLYADQFPGVDQRRIDLEQHDTDVYLRHIGASSYQFPHAQTFTYTHSEGNNLYLTKLKSPYTNTSPYLIRV